MKKFPRFWPTIIWIVAGMILLFWLVSTCSCTKEQPDPQERCVNVYWVSYKFRKDTTLIKTDTFAKDCLHTHWLSVHLQAKEQWSYMCDTTQFYYELLKPHTIWR